MIYLPIELQEKIIDYKYEIEHRKNTNNLLNKIKKKAIEYIYNNIEPFEENFDKNQADYIMSYITKCNCCNRHKEKRPTLEDYRNGYCPEYKTSIINLKYNCRCPCRHIARDICRIMNDEILDI